MVKPCLTRTHFRGVSKRHRRATHSIHSVQKLVPSEVSLRMAEFQEISPGTANDWRNRQSTCCSGSVQKLLKWVRYCALVNPWSR